MNSTFSNSQLIKDFKCTGMNPKCFRIPGRMSLLINQEERDFHFSQKISHGESGGTGTCDQNGFIFHSFLSFNQSVWFALFVSCYHAKVQDSLSYGALRIPDS